MTITISWRRVLPVLAVSLLAVGLVSFVGSNKTAAHEQGNWNNGAKYYLKLAGVPGGSTAKGHEGEIQLSSYRIMENEPDTGEQQTALAPLGDNNLRFLAETSKASPLLFAKAMSGDPIADAVLTVQKRGKQNDYLTIKLTDLVIASYQNSGNDQNNSLDEVLINYGSIEIEHNEGTPFKKGWDFKKKQEL
jgi:type VI secretion system Hcp family effector